jgi:uncharacterized membrane-anchored protein
MFGEEILQTIKGIGDTALKAVDMFTVSNDEKMAYKIKMQNAIFDATKEGHEFVFKMLENARNREIQTGDKTTRQLAWLYTFGYFGIFVLLIAGVVKLSPDTKELITVLMAVLTAGQYSILTYYFGSSHGSSQKDRTLDRIANHQPDTK